LVHYEIEKAKTLDLGYMQTGKGKKPCGETKIGAIGRIERWEYIADSIGEKNRV